MAYTGEKRRIFSVKPYVRVFLVLFMMELVIGGIGYQLGGRLIEGATWAANHSLVDEITCLLSVTVLTTPVLCIWLMQQLRRQSKYSELLRDKENEFLSLFTYNSDVIFVLDRDGRIQDANPASVQTLGYTVKEFIRMEAQPLNQVLGMSRSETRFQLALRGQVTEFDNEFVCENGTTMRVLEKLLPIYQDAHVVGVYLIARDVTRQWENEERIWHLAHHDALTGIPNRAFFLNRLEEALSQATISQAQVAVMFIDLDRFKHINDALGHNVGDYVLKVVADRLKGCLRVSDVIGRFGGDEFTVFLPNLHHVDSVRKLSEQMLAAIQQPINHDGYVFTLTSSIGISIYPNSGQTSTEVLRHADAAMYEAKRNGKNQYKLYMSSMYEHTYERMRLEHDFRSAMEYPGDLYVEYQPQISVTNGRVVSAEALTRWNHPILGMIPPSEFVSMAEEAGLIEHLGAFVLKSACKQIRRWLSLGKQPVPVAINVSVAEIEKPEYVPRFKSILAEADILPQCICIEITESAITKDAPATYANLMALREMGIMVHIDDFGKGYSSLGFLKQLPVDTLKLDEIFLRDVDKNPEDASIVAAIITLAHSRQLRVIAEGVERKPQLDILKDYQCDAYQGYYFSPSVSGDTFAKRYL